MKMKQQEIETLKLAAKAMDGTIADTLTKTTGDNDGQPTKLLAKRERDTRNIQAIRI